MPAPSTDVTMAKKRAAKGTNNACPHDEDIEKYDMKISRQRLESRGFVPSVSTRSTDEIVESWHKMVQRHVKRQALPKHDSTQRIPMTRVCPNGIYMLIYIPC